MRNPNVVTLTTAGCAINGMVDYPESLVKVGALVTTHADWTYDRRLKGKQRIGKVIEVGPVKDKRVTWIKIKWTSGRVTTVNLEGRYWNFYDAERFYSAVDSFRRLFSDTLDAAKRLE